MNKTSGKANPGVLAGIIAAAAIIAAVAAILRFDVTGRSGNRLPAEFQYDLDAFAKTDPNLILYEEISAPVPTGFGNSTCMASDPNGKLYVGGDNAIKIFAPAGKQLAIINLEIAPTALTLAEDGAIYAGLKDHVEVLDSDGKRLAVWKDAGGDAVFTAIALSRDNIFVADAGNRVVIRYDKNGEVINEIGSKNPDRNIPGFVVPSPYFDIAMANDGLLRVANPGKHRIEAYTVDSDFELSWGKASPLIDGFCGCCNPVNFALLSDGSFVTCEKGLVRVKIYDPEGVFVGVVAGPEILIPGQKVSPCESPEVCRSGGFDVAADKEGRVFVLDTINNIVRTFAKKKDDP